MSRRRTDEVLERLARRLDLLLSELNRQATRGVFTGYGELLRLGPRGVVDTLALELRELEALLDRLADERLRRVPTTSAGASRRQRASSPRRPSDRSQP